MSFVYLFGLLALCSTVGFLRAASVSAIDDNETYFAISDLDAFNECSQSISDLDCKAYATTVNRKIEYDDDSWGPNGDNRPNGCFIDESYPNKVFFNPGGVNYADSACNPGYKSICMERHAVCDGYFCDKTLSTMFLFMTHNSYATDERVFVHNQNLNETAQFDAGIRGFNFDIYDKKGEITVDHTPHSNTWTPSPYEDSVQQVLDRLETCEHRNELVVIDLELKKSDPSTYSRAARPWGDKVIKNYDSSKPFSYYLSRGQQVLLFMNKGVNYPNIGMHRRSDFITQNGYEWNCDMDDLDLSFREGPYGDSDSAKLMNHFCYTFKLPDQSNSATVNDRYVIMNNARQFSRQLAYGYSMPNIIVVDFVDKGNIWPAQDLIRNEKRFVGDELDDGTVCTIGSSCYKCKDRHSFWYSKVMTACGKERCWADGTRCAAGTSCGACCSETHGYWDSLLFTACGKESISCLSSGTICWRRGSCNDCCSTNVDCPWYGFSFGCKCG